MLNIVYCKLVWIYMYIVRKIELVLSYKAVLCVVLQKAATLTQIYSTATTSECGFRCASRGCFVSMVGAVDAWRLDSAMAMGVHFRLWPGHLFLPHKLPMSSLARSRLNWRREQRLDDGWWGERRSKICALMIATSRMNQKRYLHQFVPERPDG